MPCRLTLCVVCGLLLGAVTAVPVLHGQQPFPSRLEDYLTKELKITPQERDTLTKGGPVARNQPADASKEVALFGAIWIYASPSKYLTLLQDIENFEKGSGFRATKKVSEPAQLADFAALELPPEDVEDLRSCKVGSCELKLSAESLGRVKKEIDWTKPDVKAQLDRLMRQMALEYVNQYRAGGNSRLAVYRDSEHPTFVENEFRELLNGMPALAEHVPEMRQYLLEYPKPPARPTTSFIYWQEAQFGLKPTIRISHVAIQEHPDAIVVASKQLYSSHYFWTALEVRLLIPDPARGNGFWFVNSNRSRSDGLSGFVGSLIRGKVRESARSGLQSALIATKKLLEAR